MKSLLTIALLLIVAATANAQEPKPRLGNCGLSMYGAWIITDSRGHLAPQYSLPDGWVEKVASLDKFFDVAQDKCLCGEFRLVTVSRPLKDVPSVQRRKVPKRSAYRGWQILPDAFTPKTVYTSTPVTLCRDTPEENQRLIKLTVGELLFDTVYAVRYH